MTDTYVPEFYVPINYSNVIDAIPPGEDIIYSTMCLANRSFGTFSKRPFRLEWKSHVLITLYGVAFTLFNKNQVPELVYVPLHDIIIGKNYILASGGIFTLIRQPEFESVITFARRSNEFQAKFKPFITLRKQERKLEKKMQKEGKKREKKRKKEEKRKKK